jgi:hypothetical protein
MPANSVGDDIEMYADESRGKVVLTWHNLRQQNERPPAKPNYCLADFVAPKATGVRDYLGAFAVTTGLGIEKHVARFEAAKDDYSAIMLKALADRLAEGFAEWLHRKCDASSGHAQDEAPRHPGARARNIEAFDWRRLPGVPRARRESTGFQPAARDRNRHVADGEFRDASGRSGVGLAIAILKRCTSAVGKVGDDQAADFRVASISVRPACVDRADAILRWACATRAPRASFAFRSAAQASTTG